jgi:hypothetical protein
LTNVKIDQSKTTEVLIPAPGLLVLQKNSEVMGSILSLEKGQLLKVYDLKIKDKIENIALQPGKYRVVYRAKFSRSIHTSVDKEIEITNSAQLSDLEFCQKVNNILNKDLSNIYFTKLNPSRDYILDNKLIKSIGYTQTGNFISKLTDTISWYQNNKWF